MISDAPGVMVGSLNMTDDRDRGLVREALDGYLRSKHKKYPEPTPEFVANVNAALEVALRWALEKGDQRAIVGIRRTIDSALARMQADEHLAIRVLTGVDAARAAPQPLILVMPPPRVLHVLDARDNGSPVPAPGELSG